MIDCSEFWKIIDEARHRAAKVTDIPDCLTDILKEKSVADLLEFEKQSIELFANAYDARLWAAASLTMDFCSDDTFMDFRRWLIAQGKSAYEQALENPDTLADLDLASGDYEKPLLFDLAAIAVEIYRERTGLFEMPLDYSKYLYPNLKLANKEFELYDATKLSTIFPKLFAKYKERRSKEPKSEAVFPPID